MHALLVLPHHRMVIHHRHSALTLHHLPMVLRHFTHVATYPPPLHSWLHLGDGVSGSGGDSYGDDTELPRPFRHDMTSHGFVPLCVKYRKPSGHHMIWIIQRLFFEADNSVLRSLNIAACLQVRQHSVNNFTREPQFSGEFLDRASQPDRSPIRVGVERKVMENTLTSRAYVATFQPRAKGHNLPSEHCHVFLRHGGASLELGKHRSLGIESTHRIGHGDYITMIPLGKQRGFCDGLPASGCV